MSRCDVVVFLPHLLQMPCSFSSAHTTYYNPHYCIVRISTASQPSDAESTAPRDDTILCVHVTCTRHVLTGAQNTDWPLATTQPWRSPACCVSQSEIARGPRKKQQEINMSRAQLQPANPTLSHELPSHSRPFTYMDADHIAL